MLWSFYTEGQYAIRCTDGHTSMVSSGIYYAWIRADGTARAPTFPGLRWRDALHVQLSGTTATGAFRMLGLHARTPFPHGPSCDSDPISFQGAWVAPR
jgi:hypothetical protein